MSNESIRERKRRLRETALADRDLLPANAHRAASERIREQILQLPEMAHARTVFVFVSFGSEVDTHGLIDSLLARGQKVAVPRIMDATTIRAVPMNGWDDLAPGKWGILAPLRDDPAPGPFDAAIIPGVAFTESRQRIGHGRGYYDRWLEANPVGSSIALAFERQLVPELPVEPHDRPVDMIVTEQRVIAP